MRRMYVVFCSLAVLFGVGSMSIAAGDSAGTTKPAQDADQFPRGCVDCHVNRAEESLDVRISTQMRRWYESVDPELIARLRPPASVGMPLKGRHPELPEMTFRDIPENCVSCHGSGAPEGLRLGPMLHLIHLVGEEENHFISLFGGSCRHCHKFDSSTGQWSMPSGPEKSFP